MDLKKTKRTETEKKKKQENTHSNTLGKFFKGQRTVFQLALRRATVFAAILAIAATAAILKESTLIKLIITITKYSQTDLIGYQLIGKGTACHPIRFVIILVIKQIGLPLRGLPILLITRTITDQISKTKFRFCRSPRNFCSLDKSSGSWVKFRCELSQDWMDEIWRPWLSFNLAHYFSITKLTSLLFLF